jgi:hypothetical protein
MPQPSQTPYATKLRAMAKATRKAGDQAACDVLCAMLALVQQGRYAPLPELFRKLSPIYCVRLGDPPESREHDRA